MALVLCEAKQGFPEGFLFRLLGLDTRSRNIILIFLDIVGCWVDF